MTIPEALRSVAEEVANGYAVEFTGPLDMYLAGLWRAFCGGRDVFTREEAVLGMLLLADIVEGIE